MKSSKDRREQKKKILKKRVLLLIVFVLVIGLIWMLIQMKSTNSKNTSIYTDSQGYHYQIKPKIDVRLLTPNDYSRPKEALESVQNIVIHYVANPMTSALSNRNYFEGLKDSHRKWRLLQMAEIRIRYRLNVAMKKRMESSIVRRISR